MITNPNRYSVAKESLLSEDSTDRQHGLAKSPLQAAFSPFTKFASFQNAAGWSLVAWLAMLFLISSADALPSSTQDTVSPAGGKDHFGRRSVLLASSSSKTCQGSLVDWDMAHVTVLPTKHLKIEVLSGPIYGAIEVRTGNVANTQRMPEVHFAASVTQNDASGGLQVIESSPGSTSSTFTLSVAPLPVGSIPYCAVVNITVVIPVDTTAPYFDGELAFDTKYVNVNATSDLDQLSIGKFSFRSKLGNLFAPSLRTKVLDVKGTEGDVIIESLRSYDNESPVVTDILTSGFVQLSVKTSPAKKSTTMDGAPHSLVVNGGYSVTMDVSPDTSSIIPNTTAGELVPRPVKIRLQTDEVATLHCLLAEGQELLLDVDSFYKAFVIVSDNYLGPFTAWGTGLVNPVTINEKPGSVSKIVYEKTDLPDAKVGVKQIPGGSAGLANSSITIFARRFITLSFI